MSRVRRETVAAGAAARGMRLDLYLVNSLPDVSRKALKRALDGGRVFLDGRVERRAGFLLVGAETITVTLEGAPLAPELSEAVVLFRDAHLLALDKPAGIPVHPAVPGRPSVLDMVGSLPALGKPILLHRLDAGTSGVLLFALSEEANREMARQFAEREVFKHYVALVAGAPPESFAVRNRLRAGVRGRTVVVEEGGQEAETEFVTVARGAGFALVDARPRTGRTHQIRVHLAGEGYPLLGDTLYGGPSAVRIDGEALSAGRYLLHARQLRFRHPASAEEISITAPLPEDFRRFFSYIENADSIGLELP
jgi:RluA family pseudouridine synthase